MGTPGDKKKAQEIVKSEQPDLEQDEEIQQGSQPTEEEMGFLNLQLPHFETLPLPSLTSTVSLPIIKLESYPSTSNLEQAHIEDYYSQSKFYTSTLFEPSSSYGSVLATPQKTFSPLDQPQPGPSGLQTPKAKLAKSPPRVNVKKKSKPSLQQTPTKPHTCQVCQKSYANSENLVKHQQTHATVSPFKCEHCKKSFTSKFKLVRHVLIHSDRKPFSCSVCERTFHRKDHLTNHIKVHSPMKKVYLCEKENCKKEYTSLMSYRKHLALHAAQEGSLQCQICSNVFQTKEEILFHLKIHAGSRTVKDPNEKKYTCEHCDRKFFTKKDVRRHLVVHTGMRNFLCQFCPQRFGRKDHLGRHIKKSHSKSLPTEDLLETAGELITETAAKIETIVKSEYAPDLTPSEISFGAKSLISETKFIKSETGEQPSSMVGENLTESEIFKFCLDESLFPEEMGKFLEENVEEPLSFFPTGQSDLIQILEDLGPAEQASSSVETGVLGEPSLPTESSGLLSETEVFNNPEIQRLLQPSEEVNLPLPGFQQTFQSPPPPP